jgi:DnaJ-class molecular chaperone
VTAKLTSQCRCKKCKGEKVVKEKTRQEIFIEKGMSDRQRIVLAGAGDQEVVFSHHPSGSLEHDVRSPVCPLVMSSFF